MITIDLLPAEDVRAAATARRARAVALGIAVSAGLALLVGHAALEAATLFSRRRLIRTDAELAALERPVAALRRRLTGIAIDDQTIADFLARLRATGALATLDLEEAGRDDRSPHARRFVVTGGVEGGR